MVRKIKAKLVLQLRAEGLSGRAIAASQGMSRKSITAVLEAAEAAGVDWDEVAERPEVEVYALLFPGRGEHESVFVQPDWDRVPCSSAAPARVLWRGEQPKLNPKQGAHLVSLVHSGGDTTLEVAELLGIGRSSVYPAIERQRVAAKANLADANPGR